MGKYDIYGVQGWESLYYYFNTGSKHKENKCILQTAGQNNFIMVDKIIL
jgi:hypothetical protein